MFIIGLYFLVVVVLSCQSSRHTSLIIIFLTLSIPILNVYDIESKLYNRAYYITSDSDDCMLYTSYWFSFRCLMWDSIIMSAFDFRTTCILCVIPNFEQQSYETTKNVYSGEYFGNNIIFLVDKASKFTCILPVVHCGQVSFLCPQSHRSFCYFLPATFHFIVCDCVHYLLLSWW